MSLRGLRTHRIRKSMTRRQGTLTVLLILLILSACNSEKNREIFEDFEGEEGIYMIKMPPALFLGMLNAGSETDNVELGNIDFIKLMVFDESKSTAKSSGDILKEIINKFDHYGYEMTIQFSSGGSDISAYLLDNGDFISDLMIVINGEDGLVGLGLSGNLDGKALMELASTVDYEELMGLVDINGFGL
jgi:hypothetical protein